MENKIRRLLGLYNCLTLVHATTIFLVQQSNAYSLAVKRSSELNLYQSYMLLKCLLLVGHCNIWETNAKKLGVWSHCWTQQIQCHIVLHSKTFCSQIKQIGLLSSCNYFLYYPWCNTVLLCHGFINLHVGIYNFSVRIKIFILFYQASEKLCIWLCIYHCITLFLVSFFSENLKNHNFYHQKYPMYLPGVTVLLLRCCWMCFLSHAHPSCPSASWFKH